MNEALVIIIAAGLVVIVGCLGYVTFKDFAKVISCFKADDDVV